MIVARDNGSGLTRDAQIFRSALENAGHSVGLVEYDSNPPNRPQADVALFLELFTPRWSRCAHQLTLVPNQEWFPEQDIPSLSLIDIVLCKTRYAEQVMRGLGAHTEYMSMTSEDRSAPPLGKWALLQKSYCLHIAGKSEFKGTRAVLEAWGEHPEWPQLVLLSRVHEIQGEPPSNVKIAAQVNDKELRAMQNGAFLHIQPSEVEGFGHVIAEALSTGIPTITTDAPPMNEMITPGRGYLVPYDSVHRRCMGERFETTGELLTPVIEEALNDPDAQTRGRMGREWWEFNDAFFKRRITEIFS